MEAAITAGIASSTEMVTDVLTANLPAVLLVFGGLVALAIVLRVVGRTIGRKA